MFGWVIWEIITLVIFEDLEVALTKFSKMHSCNLSQIVLPNMLLLVLIFPMERGNIQLHLAKRLEFKGFGPGFEITDQAGL